MWISLGGPSVTVPSDDAWKPLCSMSVPKGAVSVRCLFCASVPPPLAKDTHCNRRAALWPSEFFVVVEVYVCRAVMSCVLCDDRRRVAASHEAATGLKDMEAYTMHRLSFGARRAHPCELPGPMRMGMHVAMWLRRKSTFDTRCYCCHY